MIINTLLYSIINKKTQQERSINKQTFINKYKYSIICVISFIVGNLFLYNTNNLSTIKELLNLYLVGPSNNYYLENTEEQVQIYLIYFMSLSSILSILFFNPNDIFISIHPFKNLLVVLDQLNYFDKLHHIEDITIGGFKYLGKYFEMDTESWNKWFVLIGLETLFDYSWHNLANKLELK